jgi:hypothetical protein
MISSKSVAKSGSKVGSYPDSFACTSARARDSEIRQRPVTLIQYFKVYREQKLAYDWLSHLILNLYTKDYLATPPQRWEAH